MKGRQERHIDSSLRHNATTPQRIIKVFSIQNKVAVEFYYYIYIYNNKLCFPALHIGICLMIRCGDGTMWRKQGLRVGQENSFDGVKWVIVR